MSTLQGKINGTMGRRATGLLKETIKKKMRLYMQRREGRWNEIFK